MEDSNNPMNQPDPLLKSGAFIDPNPSSFNGPSSHPNPDGQMGASSFDPNPEVQMSGGVPNSGGTGEGAAQPGQTDNDAYVIPTPDWLPPDWTCIERVRASGATAGTRDKYYIEPGTRRRFRSKKEVEHYLKTGTPKKKKTADSDADSAAGSEPSSSSKRKKAGAKVKDAWKNFKFDDVPKKVTWELTDVYEGTWTPLVNGVDGISESEMQEWSAAFTYLSLKDAEI